MGLVCFGRQAYAFYGGFDLGGPCSAALDVVQPRDEVQEFTDIHLLVERVVFGQVAHAPFEGVVAIANVLTVQGHGARVCGQVAQDGTHEGGLARPIGAKESHDLPAGDRQGDVIQRFLRAEFLGDA